MKKLILSFVAFALLFSAGIANAEQKKSNLNPPYALARGFSNLMFGWLEIPRGIIYENSRIPIVGFVTGPIKGALLTAWRVLAGTVDVVAMGMTRKGLYCNQLPDFVWDASWIAKSRKDIVQPPYTQFNIFSKQCKSKCSKLGKKQYIKRNKKQCKSSCQK